MTEGFEDAVEQNMDTTEYSLPEMYKCKATMIQALTKFLNWDATDPATQANVNVMAESAINDWELRTHNWMRNDCVLD